jgi:hypothetical protein
MEELKKVIQRKMTLGATVKAVLWSFLGIRKKSAYEKDAAQLNPVHVLIIGVLAAIVFVLTLIGIIKIIVAQ